MPLTPGSRIGPYEITGSIGAGGMGEVYRARDTTLVRDVALKVLPESFASDADRLMRFKREAQTLASLNHPHIAQIYGLEQSGAAAALVMELVDGEDLSQRIARGPILLDEALPIARQIADALAAAHEQGIVHRDLKPANIKVRPDGVVKVLDFGLAKALEPAAPMSSSVSMSPTMTSPAHLRQGYGGQATMEGVILGTAAYMSPEQARGKVVDKRADIWAFGVVFYEMLMGRRPFEAGEISDVLAAVLRQPIDWAMLPPETPSSIRRLVRRCLEKDRAERLADMNDARIEIKEALAGEPIAGEVGQSRHQQRQWTRLSVGLAALSLVLASALALRLARPADGGAAPPTLMRFALVDAPSIRVNSTTTSPFGVSRDGTTVVFSADAGAGMRLWVRTLDQPAPRMLAGTEGAYQPAISPDGEWVAFVVNNHVIRKVRLSGGAPTTVATLNDLTAALAWESDDRILFEKIGSRSGLHRVSASGGQPELLIPLADGERQQRRPLMLRDARLVLYSSTSADERTTLGAFSLDDRRQRRLDVDGAHALGVIDGHLVYARQDGSLLAVLFDAPGMRVAGAPVQLDEKVSSSPFGTSVTLSESGTLVSTPPVSALSRIMLGTVDGPWVPLGDSARVFESPRFSPDGRRIAVGITEGERSDLWVFDRASAAATRVTRGGTGRVRMQDWTPDSAALVHVRSDDVWIAPVDASADPRRLVEGGATVVAGGASIVPDGRSVVVSRRVRSAEGGVDREEVVRVSLGSGAETVPIILSKSAGGMMRAVDPRVSPDGRWVAVEDRNEQQVHIRSLEGGAGVQVSDAGGSLPVWSRDSRRLFYQTSAGLMMAELRTSPDLSVVKRERVPGIPATSTVHDISLDGKTFLILAPVDPASKVLVTVNWAADVRRQLRSRPRQP